MAKYIFTAEVSLTVEVPDNTKNPTEIATQIARDTETNAWGNFEIVMGEQVCKMCNGETVITGKKGQVRCPECDGQGGFEIGI